VRATRPGPLWSYQITRMRSSSDLIKGAAYLLSTAVTIWLPFWGFRSKYELDRKLDRAAQYVRWTVVAACLITVDFEIVPPGNWAIAIGLTFFAFFAWPNLAFYLTQLLKRAGFIGKQDNSMPEV
jgi:hypothetical protein